MKKEQLEVLNITQQVLRHVLIAIAAASPEKTAVLSTTLAAASVSPKLDPMAKQMLHDLAEGVTMLASAGQTRQ